MEAMIVNAVATFSFEIVLLIFLTSFLNLKNRCRCTAQTRLRTFDERRSDATMQLHEVKSPEKVGEKRRSR